jgi:hypothetical protein
MKTNSWYKTAILSDMAKQKLNAHHQIMEERNIGGYDIVLIKVIPLNIYQIGLQQENLDFTDVSSQMQKIKPETPMNGIKQLIAGLKEVINAWKATYGKLYVISTNEAKQEKFKSILSKMGYALQEEVIMGKRVYYI